MYTFWPTVPVVPVLIIPLSNIPSADAVDVATAIRPETAASEPEEANVQVSAALR